MSDTSTTETSVSDVPNRSDVQKDSGYLSGFFDTDNDLFPVVVGVSKITPESLNRIRERLELMKKNKQESIQTKLETSIQDCRRLIEDVISLVEKVVPHDTLQEILDEVYHEHIRKHMCMDDYYEDETDE